jgi:hypothetical protein
MVGFCSVNSKDIQVAFELVIRLSTLGCIQDLKHLITNSNGTRSQQLLMATVISFWGV